MILGIDEVGRGPWAGPLVVGAVVLSEDSTIEGLTDSKKLSAKRRIALDAEIRSHALGWGLGWVHADELDKIGLSAALKLATIRAVEAVTVPYHEIIIDGTINFLKETNKGQYVTTLPKADFLIPAVSAASIVAKVARDTYMEAQGLLYPEYGFDSHVGYGTAKHSAALAQHGVTSLHRKSFAPIAKLVTPVTNPLPLPAKEKGTMSTKQRGDTAESIVSALLESQGYRIVNRNWKTKHCEIDIIASKQSITYFVEVKYRASTEQGGAVAAITPQKLKQMKFAAELYSARHAPEGAIQLMVATVTKDGVVDLLKVE